MGSLRTKKKIMHANIPVILSCFSIHYLSLLAFLRHLSCWRLCTQTGFCVWEKEMKVPDICDWFYPNKVKSKFEQFSFISMRFDIFDFISCLIECLSPQFCTKEIYSSFRGWRLKKTTSINPFFLQTYHRLIALKRTISFDLELVLVGSLLTMNNDSFLNIFSKFVNRLE